MFMQSRSLHILAIDIRAQQFGFVLIEEPNIILDCGVSGYRGNLKEALRHKIARLSELFAPSLILSRHNTKIARHQVSVRATLDVLKQEARRRSVTLRFISASSLRQYFSDLGRRNKHEVSQAVVAHFPELAWRLPKKRKPWQNEPATQALFDAAALALMHLARSEKKTDT